MISLLSVWPSTGCNLRCKYCFYEGSCLWTQKREDMTLETADAVIKLINSGLVGSISFFGGEPLINWPIVKYILEKTYLENIWNKEKTYYNITTNGTLLTHEILDMFEKRRVHINLSLDGTKRTQNMWRGNSYESIMKNLDRLLKYPKLQILKTMATPASLYEDVKHIKDLGFKQMFINMLDPYSHFTYEKDDVEDFKQQYRHVIEDLRDSSFLIGDYGRWRKLITAVHKGKKNTGCGFTNHGFCVAPDGRLYPCQQGPACEEFTIGDVWNGIDKEKEKKVRQAEPAPICMKCVYKFSKCVTTMHQKHGQFGMDPPEWHMKFELAKIRVIEELEGLPHLEAACKNL